MTIETNNSFETTASVVCTLVKAHTLVGATPTVNGCDLSPPTRTQTSEQEYNELMATNREAVNIVLPQHFPKLFSRNPVVCFLDVDKTNADIFVLPRSPRKFCL